MNVSSTMITAAGKYGVGYGFGAPSVEEAVRRVMEYARDIDAAPRFRAVEIEVSVPCVTCHGNGHVARDRRRKFSMIFNSKECKKCAGSGVEEIVHHASHLLEAL